MGFHHCETRKGLTAAVEFGLLGLPQGELSGPAAVVNFRNALLRTACVQPLSGLAPFGPNQKRGQKNGLIPLIHLVAKNRIWLLQDGSNLVYVQVIFFFRVFFLFRISKKEISFD